jgi:hypothetical protein
VVPKPNRLLTAGPIGFKTLPLFEKDPNRLGVVKDVTNAMIAQSINVGKDSLSA